MAKLDPLAGLAALAPSTSSGNQVADLGPLGNLARLASLYLARNQVADIGPISKLSRLVTLNVSDNQIEQIGPLTKLEDLNLAILERNKIADLTPLVEAWKAGADGIEARLPAALPGRQPALRRGQGRAIEGAPGGGREDRILITSPCPEIIGNGCPTSRQPIETVPCSPIGTLTTFECRQDVHEMGTEPIRLVQGEVWRGEWSPSGPVTPGSVGLGL